MKYFFAEKIQMLFSVILLLSIMGVKVKNVINGDVVDLMIWSSSHWWAPIPQMICFKLFGCNGQNIMKWKWGSYDDMRIVTSSYRAAFFVWRAPILSWPRITCSQVRMLTFSVTLVTRNALNKSVWRKKDCFWLPLNKHTMNIFIAPKASAEGACILSEMGY